MRIRLAIMASLCLAFASVAQADEALLGKAGCMACHAKDKKLLGPSFKDIAAKYKGQDASAALIQKVRVGGKGVFGPIPMPPNPAEKINDVELKDGIAWILKQ